MVKQSMSYHQSEIESLHLVAGNDRSVENSIESYKRPDQTSRKPKPCTHFATNNPH